MQKGDCRPCVGSLPQVDLGYHPSVENRPQAKKVPKNGGKTVPKDEGVRWGE